MADHERRSRHRANSIASIMLQASRLLLTANAGTTPMDGDLTDSLNFHQGVQPPRANLVQHRHYLHARRAPLFSQIPDCVPTPDLTSDMFALSDFFCS